MTARCEQKVAHAPDGQCPEPAVGAFVWAGQGPKDTRLACLAHLAKARATASAMGMVLMEVGLEAVLAHRAVEELKRLNAQAYAAAEQTRIANVVSANLAPVLGQTSTPALQARVAALMQAELAADGFEDVEVDCTTSPEDLARGVLNVSVRARPPGQGSKVE